MEKNSSEKNKKNNPFAVKDNVSYTALSQYVPIHKLENSASEGSSKMTSPFTEKKEPPKTTFSMYDSDYFKNQYSDNLDLTGGTGGKIWKLIKYLFVNMPVINILYLKFKQLKIKETISALDNMSSDIYCSSRYLQNSAVINSQKFSNFSGKQISNVVQSANLGKNFSDKF